MKNPDAAGALLEHILAIGGSEHRRHTFSERAVALATGNSPSCILQMLTALMERGSIDGVREIMVDKERLYRIWL